MYTPQEWLRHRALMLCFLGLLVGLQLPGGTYFFYPLHMFSSWIHELFHGLASLAVGGDFASLKLYADGSGMALTLYPPTRFTHVFVASAGYVCTTVAGACLLLYQWPSHTSRVLNLLLVCGVASLAVLGMSSWKGQVYYGAVTAFLLTMVCWPATRKVQICRIGMGGIGVLLLLSLVFVKEAFALIVILTMAGFCLAISVRASDKVVWLGYNILALLCAFHTLFYVQALFDSHHLTAGRPTRPSDAYLIERVFFLAPASFWSLIWLVLSLVFVVMALLHVLLAHSNASSPKPKHPWF